MKPLLRPKKPKVNIPLPAIFLIIILGFIVYGNSIKGEFVWDDNMLIKNNVYVKSWTNLTKIFREDIGAGEGHKGYYNFYRPIQTALNMAEYAAYRLDVRGYHLINIILHVLVALCVFWFTLLLFDDAVLSSFSALLFIVHPAHTEAVAYISGRADPLAALFALLCFITYIKYMGSGKVLSYFYISIFYVLSILSKETSLIMPILILLYHYFFRKKVDWKRFLLIITITLIYIAYRVITLKEMTFLSAGRTTLIDRVPGFFAAVAGYIKILLIPVGLHMEYGTRIFSFLDPQAAIGLILLLFIFAIMLFMKKRKSVFVFFSLSWFLIALLPVSNLYPINAYMAEHWLYFPSIGFFIILGGAFSYLYKMNKSKIAIIAIGAVCIAVCSYLTIIQNNYWREPISFYERTLKYAPGSSGLYHNLGIMYKEKGDNRRAIDSYKEAIRLNPAQELTYNNLGNAYNNTGQTADAIRCYERAIRINPQYADAYNNLANTYIAMGDRSAAIDAYRKSIELNPNFASAYSNLGSIYNAMRDYKSGIQMFKRAIEIDPSLGAAYNNLAIAYYYEKDYALAIVFADKAVKFGVAVHPEFLKLLESYR